MMVITARGDEGGLRAIAVGKLETQHATIEVERPLEIGYLEMDVTDAHAGVNRVEDFISGLFG